MPTDAETRLQRRPPVSAVTTLGVDVVAGPDLGKQATGETVSIGTAPGNALALADFTVSRFHLEAAIVAGGVAVRDLGSTNGTFVGSVRIQQAVVPLGAPVTFGGTTVQFRDAGRRSVPAPHSAQGYEGMIARAPAMLKLFEDVERVAASNASVLIVGESGTGKERVAAALHARSGRQAQPLVTIDCGALASMLIASELFGHERGAFTGADRMHAGAFERAGAGTVFLDELGELPAADQAALLGVLERRRFRRVGGTKEIEVAARVIAATNRDLRSEVNAGRFRADLYHRLAVVTVRLPALRERPEDILPLVAYFARELGAAEPMETLFPLPLLTHWEQHPWPGNVRELRNAVEAALVIGPPPSEPASVPSYKDARASVVASFEVDYLRRLLAAAGGNVSQASRIAKMDRSHLIDLLHRHGLKA